MPVTAALTMDAVVTLTDAQLEAIARRVAELLADQRPSEPPESLTVAQAAELAGVSTRTIRNWLSAGKLPRTASRIARADLMARLAVPARAPRRARTPKRPDAVGTFTELARDGSRTRS